MKTKRRPPPKARLAFALDAVGPLRGDYGEYFIDLVASLDRAGYSMLEIPYEFRNREHGESKTATSLAGYCRRGINYLTMLIRAGRR